MLQTKNALQNLVKRVRLKIYSEWTTQQKDAGTSLKRKLFDFPCEDESIIFCHFGKLRKKNAQKN